MNDAGRIGFLIKGNYDNEVTYDFLDVVNFEGSSYVAKKATIGNSPEHDSEYWHIFAQGNAVTGIKGNAETEYRTGMVNLTPADIGSVATSDVDTDLSETSENPVQNKVIKAAIDEFINNTWSLIGGKILPSGADLNDYTSVGNHYSNSNALSDTILNKPPGSSGGAFRLKIINLHGVANYLKQIYADSINVTKIFVRKYSSTSKQWSNWTELILPLINNFDTTEIGQGALDAVAGKIFANRFGFGAGTSYLFNTVESFPESGSAFGCNNGNDLIVPNCFTIKRYSRIIFMNYSETKDGALLAISPHGDVYVAFRNNGVWGNGKVLANSDDVKSLTKFTEIKEGADMHSDEYLIPGSYSCSTIVKSKTLLNCPIYNNAFTMTVTYGNGNSDYIKQIFEDYNGSLRVERRFYKPDKSQANNYYYIPLKEDSNIAAIQHRKIYRGNNIGGVLTDRQKEAISSGLFTDLFVGDYWYINGFAWRIIDINYWMGTGDIACIIPHLVIMSDTPLYSAKMNETNTTTGAYVGSQMYTTNLNNAKTLVNSAFGSANILTHREYLVNKVTNGYPSDGAWYDSTIELPNEIMMYGSFVFAPAGDGSFIPNRYTIDKTQLALMKMYPRFINPQRQTQWLRDVVSSTRFALVTDHGNTGTNNASSSFGVRPVFGLIGESA
jgi:hypothetical protein